MLSATRRLPTLALVCVTAIWGSTFFLIKDQLLTLPVLDFLAVRFLLAALCLLVCCAWRMRGSLRELIIPGTVLGIAYGGGQLLQTWGLAHTDASVSGFITGMCVVFTPLLTWLGLKVRLHIYNWIAVGIALLGLGVLSLSGWSIGGGEIVTLLSALLYAVHIVLLSLWSRLYPPLDLVIVQIVVIALVCLAAAAPEGITFPTGQSAWMAMVYMALVAGVLALGLQTWAQAHMSATKAALLLTLEPIFAAIFAVWLGGENLTIRLIIGGLLILIAMQVAEGRIPQILKIVR